ncbi:MAG TPA: FtsX-like permease family protein [Anaerolineales bacterium]|nr:FtsX-like permease family protein [Anaerolineales bacterium]
MRLYLRLAWRNIWRHRRRTLIIVLAMSLGLALMMFYDGLVGGFNQAIYGSAIKILGGNIQVHAVGYRSEADQTPLLPLSDDQAVVSAALAQPQVVAATRRINTGGLASSRDGAFAVGITGIEPELELSVNLAAQHVVAGRYLTADDVDSIFIGKGLADAMGVGVGDRITLTGRSRHEQMRRRTMTVIGIYDLGMADIEKRTIYISLSEAQDLYGLSGQSTEVAIALKQLGQEAAVIAALKPGLPGYEIESFEANYPELQSALSTKGGVMNIFSVVILMIAGIGILNLLLMAVYERTREIGVLGALGLKPRQVSLLFILEGTMIGLVGVAAGIVLGLIVNGILRQVGLDFGAFASATSYMALISGRIYPNWGVDKLVGRALTVAIISALAALIPAREAAQREPAQALHHV